MFYRISDVRRTGISARNVEYLQKSASKILTDSMNFSEGRTFDVFLSHSFHDADVILGIKTIIENLGKSVYVDWVEDRNLDRQNVTAATAAILRTRMRQSRSLIYANSPSTSTSKWMPWELGYFDGFRPEMVSILPLVENYDSEWKGTEYLGLYPVIDRLEYAGERRPFVVKKNSKAQRFSEFGKSTDYIWEKDAFGRAV